MPLAVVDGKMGYDYADLSVVEDNGKYVVAKIDVDENKEIAAEYSIMSIPTIKVFKNGEAVKTALGVQTREMLLELVEG